MSDVSFNIIFSLLKMPSRNRKKTVQRKNRQRKEAARIKKYETRIEKEQKELAAQYGEYIQKDDMPGKTWQRKKLCVEPRCFGCGKKWCKCQKNCDEKPYRLACLCAPIFCGNCMFGHFKSNHTHWDDDTTTYTCPTCRKEIVVDHEDE